MKSGTTHTNRLITENSPYLLQHAHNPVDWFPWSSEAFERAREEDKPVFLSAGYSTCHWCHVMERESFEDEETARVLNAHFVSIKLDREERPDIDQIYMDAVVAMTGMGGWPLSVFLTPEGKPFYGGTYFPPREGGGRPAFRTLLLAVADAWKSRRKELLDSAGRMTALVERQSAAAAREELSRRMLTDAPGYFRGIFDAVNGGFGGAPKFPQPAILSMLLYCWYLDRDETTLEMVEKTLDAMARGGIYDHLGGGFHRYSTDERWLVPHFEKMLYDQALLAKVYVEAFQATGNRRYAVTATGVLDYVLRDMRDKGGGFYAAEDADSEGREGAFYFWAPRQIASVLPPEEAEVFNAYYGITEEGNFQRGESILSVTRTM